MANSRLCSIPNCGKRHLARGWCAMHYTRWREWGDTEGRSPDLNKPLKWVLENIEIQSDECLIFPFGKTGQGYGALYPSGEQQVMAHRWVCERVHGEAPEGKNWVAHSCANGHLGCVNPRHLRWASPLENAADRVDHGHAPRGTNHSNNKLTETQVIEIMRLKGSMSSRQAGSLFGVTNGAIDGIWRGKTWTWLTGHKA